MTNRIATHYEIVVHQPDGNSFVAWTWTFDPQAGIKEAERECRKRKVPFTHITAEPLKVRRAW